MRKTQFLISSLVAAGIAPATSSHAQSQAALTKAGGPPHDPDEAVVRRFAQDHAFILAQHRSHASHASHSSHRSGSSGVRRAPVYTPPAPRTPRTAPAPSPTRNERSTPPSSILPASPATVPQSLYAPPGEAARTAPTRSQIEEVVAKVQLGLAAYGYYDGVIDARVGPKTRAALTAFQTDFNLKVTGTITPEVLDALRVVAK